MDDLKKAIDKMQIHSMKMSHCRGLEYHNKLISQGFKNYNIQSSFNIDARDCILYNSIAYLNLLKRFYDFYRGTQKKYNLPTNHDINRKIKPLVMSLSNKFSSHRSVDWPKNDSLETQLTSASMDYTIFTDEDGPFWSITQQNGNETIWHPLQEHGEIMQICKNFINFFPE